MLDVKIKILKGGILPTQGSSNAAGWDLYLPTSVYLAKKILTHVPLKICMKIPDGYYGLIAERSSISKMEISLANKVGVIDSDYIGEITLALLAEHTRLLSKGTRIAQLIFHKHELASFDQVDELEETGRGAGGFGSTGI